MCKTNFTPHAGDFYCFKSSFRDNERFQLSHLKVGKFSANREGWQPCLKTDPHAESNFILIFYFVSYKIFYVCLLTREFMKYSKVYTDMYPYSTVSVYCTSNIHRVVHTTHYTIVYVRVYSYLQDKSVLLIHNFYYIFEYGYNTEYIRESH